MGMLSVSSMFFKGIYKWCKLSDIKTLRRMTKAQVWITALYADYTSYSAVTFTLFKAG